MRSFVYGAILGAAVLTAGCTQNPYGPYYNGYPGYYGYGYGYPYNTSYNAGYYSGSTWNSGNWNNPLWRSDMADGTRPYYCTEQRMQFIAKQNTDVLRMMSQSQLGVLPSGLLGPQRKDALQMPFGERLEVWYFRSYVDSTDTSYAYSVGLTPIVVDMERNVKAVGDAGTNSFRARAYSIRTLSYAQPCQAETVQTAPDWTYTGTYARSWFW